MSLHRGVGAVVSLTVIVWLQVMLLPLLSVAVQVRLVLLTSLPLTGRDSSAELTERLLLQVSLKSGAPNSGVAGHSMVASAGQEVTVGLVVSRTVIVWLQVILLPLLS